jgi:hypothetical protein
MDGRSAFAIPGISWHRDSLRANKAARPEPLKFALLASATGHEDYESRSYRLKGGRLMVPVISANALLVWFVWGFFMAMGWALGTWIMGRLLGMVWRERP